MGPSDLIGIKYLPFTQLIASKGRLIGNKVCKVGERTAPVQPREAENYHPLSDFLTWPGLQLPAGGMETNVNVKFRETGIMALKYSREEVLERRSPAPEIPPCCASRRPAL
jgi:hypothetical protein